MKKRRNLLLCFVSGFILAAGCHQDPLAKMPYFNVRLDDSITEWSTTEIPTGQKTVIIHFDSDCHECQLETDSLLQNMDQLKDTHFYFLTVQDFERLRTFRDYYKLYNYPNITVAQDFSQYFPRFFKTASTPLLAIYNGRKRLVGVYEGKAPIRELVTKINEVKD